MTWTPKDEQRRAALIAELENLNHHRNMAFENLRGVVKRAGLEPGAADKLILFADSIRDALAPFDSGVRAEPPVIPMPADVQIPAFSFRDVVR